MFEINDKDIQQLERDLVAFKREALPFATRKTLNDAAFQAQQIARADVKREFITRNRYTEQSIQVTQARGMLIPRQVAVVGSIAPYMEDQEFGGTKQKHGRHGVPLPTSYSAGQGMGAKPRTRLPRRPNRLANIQLKRGRKRGASRAQQNLIAVKEAAASARKTVYLDLGRKRGIFRVTGGVRRPQLRMLYDLSEGSVSIPRKPWLAPAHAEAARMLPAFYADALRFQLRRHGLFRSR